MDPQTAPGSQADRQGPIPGPGLRRLCPGGSVPDPQGKIVFNEINTIPGFTEHSRFPGMMQAAGMTFPEILDTILGQVMAP
ncbi:MAG: hypothetical protein ACLSCQ_05000 [Evtepia gabavorous]